MTSWVDKKEGWLKNYSKRKSRHIVIEEETKKEEPAKRGIFFIRPKCPKCRSKNIRCYKTDGSIRYYKCECGHKFKAYEKES